MAEPSGFSTRPIDLPDRTGELDGQSPNGPLVHAAEKESAGVSKGIPALPAAETVAERAKEMLSALEADEEFSAFAAAPTRHPPGEVRRGGLPEHGAGPRDRVR